MQIDHQSKTIDLSNCDTRLHYKALTEAVTEITKNKYPNFKNYDFYCYRDDSFLNEYKIILTQQQINIFMLLQPKVSNYLHYFNNVNISEVILQYHTTKNRQTPEMVAIRPLVSFFSIYNHEVYASSDMKKNLLSDYIAYFQRFSIGIVAKVFESYIENKLDFSQEEQKLPVIKKLVLKCEEKQNQLDFIIKNYKTQSLLPQTNETLKIN